MRRRDTMGRSRCWQTTSKSTLDAVDDITLAAVITFVDMRTKLEWLLIISRRFRRLLQSPSCWEPLRMDRSMSKCLLHKLNQANSCRSLPTGICSVFTMSCDLTELDENGVENFCREINLHFHRLQMLDCWYSDRSLSPHARIFLRCRELIRFEAVVTYPDEGGDMLLQARRSGWPPLSLLAPAIQQLNRDRLPIEIPFDPSTTFSETEALFLLENPYLYKNGTAFWRRDTSNEARADPYVVRRLYGDLIKSR